MSFQLPKILSPLHCQWMSQHLLHGSLHYSCHRVNFLYIRSNIFCFLVSSLECKLYCHVLNSPTNFIIPKLFVQYQLYEYMKCNVYIYFYIYILYTIYYILYTMYIYTLYIYTFHKVNARITIVEDKDEMKLSRR